MRARVFREDYGGGAHAWVYEIFDPARPEGNQLHRTGIRSTWREALLAAWSWFKRAAP